MGAQTFRLHSGQKKQRCPSCLVKSQLSSVGSGPRKSAVPQLAHLATVGIKFILHNTQVNVRQDKFTKGWPWPSAWRFQATPNTKTAKQVSLLHWKSSGKNPRGATSSRQLQPASGLFSCSFCHFPQVFYILSRTWAPSEYYRRILKYWN